MMRNLILPLSFLICITANAQAPRKLTFNFSDPLEKLQQGQILLLSKVKFKNDTLPHLSAGEEQIDQLVNFLAKHDKIMIRLSVYDESCGNDSMCIALRQVQADLLYDLIEEKGIDPSRVNALGYGKSKFLVTPEQRQLLAQKMTRGDYLYKGVMVTILRLKPNLQDPNKELKLRYQRKRSYPLNDVNSFIRFFVGLYQRSQQPC